MFGWMKEVGFAGRCSGVSVARSLPLGEKTFGLFTVFKSKWDVLVFDSEEKLKEFMFVISIIKVFWKYS